MMRHVILAALVVAFVLGLTGRGLIAMGLNRTSNTLTTPRLADSHPQQIAEGIRIDLQREVSLG